ncbi:MAG: flagellar biosynthesis protein FlhF [Eubacteriales bacterium]
MMIKKYKANTQEEAVANARKDMGEAAIMLSSRLVSNKGILKILKPKLIEVTMALEEREKQETSQSRVVETPIVTSVNPEQPKPQFSIFTPELIEKTEHKKGETEEPKKAIEEKLDSLQNLIEKQIQLTEVKEEEAKEEENQQTTEKMQFFQLIYNTLIEHEVKEIYANQIIDEVEKATKDNTPIDQMLAHIYQRMILKFGKPECIQPAENTPKLLFCIGSTGVGKTTTIAKIASKFRVEEKQKVALITADTYRIAAAEQLRTYANILEVPFRVIYSCEDLLEAITDYKEYDYIIVDTAGHSQFNNELKSDVISLITSIPDDLDKEVFLVLSATTKYKDLVNIAKSYEDDIDYKIIFTKMDETSSVGNLFNLHMETGKALSYVTCGQNVPDDIENFNPQRTVKLLLGGKK